MSNLPTPPEPTEPTEPIPPVPSEDIIRENTEESEALLAELLNGGPAFYPERVYEKPEIITKADELFWFANEAERLMTHILETCDQHKGTHPNLYLSLLQLRGKIRVIRSECHQNVAAFDDQADTIKNLTAQLAELTQQRDVLLQRLNFPNLPDNV